MITNTVHVAVDPDWIGRSINGEAGKSEGLRNAIIAAQRQVLDQFEKIPPVLSIRFEIEGDDGRWRWNPQYPLPKGTTTLYCVAEDFR